MRDVRRNIAVRFSDAERAELEEALHIWAQVVTWEERSSSRWGRITLGEFVRSAALAKARELKRSATPAT